MITKAIRQYLEADATLMTDVKNVFTFYNAINMRRVNNALSKNTFPMITVNELSKTLNTVHQIGTEQTSRLRLRYNLILSLNLMPVVINRYRT